MTYGVDIVDLDWIQSFTAAAKQESFSKAANEMNISQPALSKHVRNLENHLDVKLFHRTPSGIRLTEAGIHFYKRIRPIMSEIGRIRSELREYNKHHPIAIGSLPSIATYYLPSRIRNFEFADRSFSLMLQNTSKELIQSLKEERLDVVFIEMDYDDEALWRHELFTEPYYALFSLDHKYNSKEAVQLIELCEEPLITHQAPCDVRSHIIHQMDLIGCQPNIVSEVAFGEFIYGSVAVGEGIAIVPELLAKNTQHLNIVSLPIVDFGRKRTISLVSRNKKLGSLLYNYITPKD